MSENVSPAPVIEKVTKKFKAFDETLNLVDKEISFDFAAATSVEDAVSRIGDADKVLAALNVKLERIAASEERAKVGGIPKKVVFTFVNAFRAVPPYNAIKDRKEQTESILKNLRSMPALVAQIAAATNVEDEDDDAAE